MSFLATLLPAAGEAPLDLADGDHGIIWDACPRVLERARELYSHWCVLLSPSERTTTRSPTREDYDEIDAILEDLEEAVPLALGKIKGLMDLIAKVKHQHPDERLTEDEAATYLRAQTLVSYSAEVDKAVKLLEHILDAPAFERYSPWRDT